jgi:lipoyl(octanoyl) transferase
MTLCEVRRPGLLPYQDAWELQKRLAAQRAAGMIPDTLLMLEHPHTYTFGRSGNRENLLWDEAACAAKDITVEWVDRGGDVTYHGPGQVVAYPILSLGAVAASEGGLPKADYVGYIRKLEDVIIHCLMHFGLVTGQLPGITGIFIHPDGESRCAFCPPHKRKVCKIAAIGVKVDGNGISQHGFAINVEPDMDYFEGIIGCGLKDHPAISMAELMLNPPTVNEVMNEVARQFGKVFGYEMAARAEVGWVRS